MHQALIYQGVVTEHPTTHLSVHQVSACAARSHHHLYSWLFTNNKYSAASPSSAGGCQCQPL